MAREHEFEVEELRDVLAAALLGLDDDAEPPEVVVTRADGGDLRVAGVVYHPRDNTLYLHTSGQRPQPRHTYRYSWEDLYGAVLRQQEDTIGEAIRRERNNPPY